MNALLVDDHALFREGLALLMRQRFPHVLLGQAVDLAQAQALLQAHPEVELVLLDLNLRDSHGLASLTAMQASSPERSIVVMSADERPETVDAVIAAGGAGYIPKTARGGVIEAALRVVLDGGVYLPRGVLRAARVRGRSVREALAAQGVPVQDGDHYAAVAQDAFDLSPRQVEVLRGLIDSKSSKVIARELLIAESSVKSHLLVIFKKLRVNSRAAAVLEAVRLGLGSE
jgi:DNA-binding NarL/FixJ family response regulator